MTLNYTQQVQLINSDTISCDEITIAIKPEAIDFVEPKVAIIATVEDNEVGELFWGPWQTKKSENLIRRQDWQLY